MIGRHEEYKLGTGFRVNRVALISRKEALRLAYERPTFIPAPGVAKGSPPKRPLPFLAVDPAQAEPLHAIITVASRRSISDNAYPRSSGMPSSVNSNRSKEGMRISPEPTTIGGAQSCPISSKRGNKRIRGVTKKTCHRSSVAITSSSSRCLGYAISRTRNVAKHTWGENLACHRTGPLVDSASAIALRRTRQSDPDSGCGPS
jgi:hypothetical protein